MVQRVEKCYLTGSIIQYKQKNWELDIPTLIHPSYPGPDSCNGESFTPSGHSPDHTARLNSTGKREPSTYIYGSLLLVLIFHIAIRNTFKMKHILNAGVPLYQRMLKIIFRNGLNLIFLFISPCEVIRWGIPS